MTGLGQSIRDNTVKELNLEKIKKMIQKGYSKTDILDLDYTEEEFAEAKQELSQTT